MRITALLSLLIGSTITFGAEPARLMLSDEKRAIQELRPLDRFAWVLTLEGKWKAQSPPSVKHYVNVFFPNGASASHRVLSEDYARKGDFRVVIQENDLLRNGATGDTRLTIVVSQDKAVTSVTDPAVMSEPFVTAWPLDRPLVKRPVHTRHTPPEPLDAFPLPDDANINYKKQKESK